MKHVNLDNVKEMVAGDTAFLASLIDSYVEKTSPALEKLKEETLSKNWDIVAGIAHKLLSSTTIFNADELSMILKSIENDCKAGQNLEEMPHRVEKANEINEEVIRELRDEQEEMKSE